MLLSGDKLVNELYADVFARTYDFKTIGLRYFNIFGRLPQTALSDGLIELTIPGKPNSRLQKYRLSAVGLRYCRT